MMRRPDPVSATCLAPPEAQVPQPSELHALVVYPPEGYPASDIAGFLAPALVEGSSAIVVATAPHRAAILAALAERGVDVAGARQGGSLVELDAATVLAELRADGPIDAAAFGEVVGPWLAGLPADGSGRVFGELVALLAEEGDLAGAVDLERIWNAAMVVRDFGLCCAYPSSAFAGDGGAAALAHVEEAHGTLLGDTRPADPGATGPSGTPGDPGGRGHAVATQRAETWNATFAGIFEASEEALLVFDDAGRYLDANPAACRLLGRPREEVRGLRVGDLTPAEIDPEPLLRALREQGELRGAYALVRPDGRVVDVEFRASAWVAPDRHLSTLRDLTPEADTVERARAAARHDDLAVWAGGVAHDMANLLTGVRGYAELGLQAAETEQTRALLREIVALAERGGTLTARLGRGSERRESAAASAVPVARVVQAASPRLERLLDDALGLVLDVPEELPSAAIDAAELERALVSLVANAVEAMPDGGTVAIRARHASAAQVVAPRYDAVHEGERPLADWVELVVADDGEGMGPEARRRAFEPLFTTKPDRGGVGLGLVSVDSAVRAAGGRVELTSAPGEGTRVRLLLPVAG